MKPHTQTPAGVSTSNQFSPLSNANTNTTAHTNSRPSNNTPKVPPIVSLDLPLTAIHAMMKSCKVDPKSYFVKFMTIGTKITLTNTNDFKTVKQYLVAQKKTFFTHDIPEERTRKFVLSGLPESNISEIKQQLVAANINCLEIKKITTKSPDKCLYLVYFNDKSVKLDQLKKTKALGNVIVKWSNYITSKNGPTQCNQCQLYGHGSKNCNLPPRCLRCSGNHHKNDCPHSEAEQFSPKCCLCNGNHQSNFPDCPKRLSYMSMRTNTSGRFNHQHIAKRTSNNPTNTLHLSQPNSFPALKPAKTNIAWNAIFRQPPPNPQTPSIRGNQPPPQNAAAFTSTQQPAENMLFSMEELLTISNTLIAELSVCRTKLEQFNVLSKLVIQFVYSSNVQ